MQEMERARRKNAVYARVCFYTALAAAILAFFTFRRFDFLLLKTGGFLAPLLVPLLMLPLAWLTSRLVHECGHLAFGLLSGYRFSVFQIGNLELVRKRGRLRLYWRPALRGFARCMLGPPEKKNGQYPYMLYLLGGVIMEVITMAGCYAALSSDTLHILWKAWFFALFWFCLSGALVNGLPLGGEIAGSEGYTAVTLAADHAKHDVLWAQMKIRQLCTDELRLKDIPEELFSLPDDTELYKGWAGAQAVLYAERIMDEHRFPEARALMERLMTNQAFTESFYGIYLSCHLICLRLLDGDSAEPLITRKLLRLMKMLGNDIDIRRTQYIYALFTEHNELQREVKREQFERAAARYPDEGAVQAARELVTLAEARMYAAQNQESQ